VRGSGRVVQWWRVWGGLLAIVGAFVCGESSECSATGGG
jgi:hypothetical protein